MSNQVAPPQLPRLPIELQIQIFQEAARLDIDHTYLNDVRCSFALTWRMPSTSIMRADLLLTCRLAHLNALEAHRQAIVDIDVDVPVGTFMARVREYERCMC